ncbi:Protein N-acetyltransferase, RimJ/RimL family [Asanoa hainanensis]|uniref:Protein N-acetyltransferase, RimJ/RimL family n=1 Tax=Asanoa hainanensis TaxID=560556 RepID=A0A239LLW7_9ACTN|nr:GNAT family N-acetyltransferase [Asanoa hainanensis]SNT31375.1 Protein N-acetyltransferase, RimJ/RimL family [Asanoa hainanensis]
MTLWRIRATVDDRPGYLSVLTASLALKAVNILAVQVHTTEAGAVDEFLVDAPHVLTEADLRAAVEKGRGRDAWIAPAEAQGLADQPTRVLGLATRLVRDPDALGDALRTLLDADAVTWRPAGPTRAGMRAGSMVLPDPTGGRYDVLRAQPDFTPAEYARAQALVDVAAAAARSADLTTLLLPDGAELVLRPATPDDLPALVAMHERCSAGTRRQRYLTGDGVPGPAQLGRLLDASRVRTLLAAVPGVTSVDTVVAMANLVMEGSLAELSVVVEDGWQRRGVGTALVRRALAHAERLGCAAVLAHTTVDNLAMERTLRRLGHPAPVRRDGAVASTTVPLRHGTSASA